MMSDDPAKRFNDLDDVVRELEKIRAVVVPGDEVAESFSRCLDTSFAEDFYNRLFENDKSLQAFFEKGIRREQYLFLRIAIHLLIHHGDDQEFLHEVAHRHAQRKVKVDPSSESGKLREGKQSITEYDYTSFEKTLLETVAKNDVVILRGGKKADKLKDLWKKRIQEGLSYMKKHGVGCPRATPGPSVAQPEHAASDALPQGEGIEGLGDA